MAIKASRYLTHVKRLGDPAEPVAKLMAAAAGLGGRLGPVLLQLPPDLAADPPRLATCLEAFASHRGTGPDGTAGVRVAVEPRHPSWWTDEVRRLLAGHGAALCWADQLRPSGHTVVADGGLGVSPLPLGGSRPWPRYGPRALHSWLERVRSAWPDEATVYVYFNNDPGGAALADSAAFAAACPAGRAHGQPHPGQVTMHPASRASR